MDNNISVNNLVSKIINQYDRNKDKVIDLKGDDTSFDSKLNSEMTRNEYQWVDSENVRKDKIDLSSVFKKADSNNDKKVDKRELTNYVIKFDLNNDRVISGNAKSSIPFFDNVVKRPDRELEKMQKANPEPKTSIIINKKDIPDINNLKIKDIEKNG